MEIFLLRSDGITCLGSRIVRPVSMYEYCSFYTYRLVLAGFLQILPALELLQAIVVSVLRIVGIVGLVKASVASVGKISKIRCIADKFPRRTAIKMRGSLGNHGNRMIRVGWGYGRYPVILSNIGSRSRASRVSNYAFPGMIGRGFKFLASIARALEVLAIICHHARAPFTNRGIGFKSATKHLDGSEWSQGGQDTVLYCTFVRVQYKVQWSCRTMYSHRTCTDLENPEEEKLEFVVERVGLLELASGDASFACEIVSRLGKELTIQL